MSRSSQFSPKRRRPERIVTSKPNLWPGAARWLRRGGVNRPGWGVGQLHVGTVSDPRPSRVRRPVVWVAARRGTAPHGLGGGRRSSGGKGAVRSVFFGSHSGWRALPREPRAARSPSAGRTRRRPEPRGSRWRVGWRGGPCGPGGGEWDPWEGWGTSRGSGGHALGSAWTSGRSGSRPRSSRSGGRSSRDMSSVGSTSHAGNRRSTRLRSLESRTGAVGVRTENPPSEDGHRVHLSTDTVGLKLYDICI